MAGRLAYRPPVDAVRTLGNKSEAVCCSGGRSAAASDEAVDRGSGDDEATESRCGISPGWTATWTKAEPKDCRSAQPVVSSVFIVDRRWDWVAPVPRYVIDRTQRLTTDHR